MMIEDLIAESAGELGAAVCEERPGVLLVLPLQVALQRVLSAETPSTLPILNNTEREKDVSGALGQN